MGRFSVDLLLANKRDMILAENGSLPPEKVRKVQCRGVVDPGATRLVLPEAVVNQLGLPSAGEVQVRYTDQRTVNRRRVDDVWLQLQNRESTFSASVEPDVPMPWWEPLSWKIWIFSLTAPGKNSVRETRTGSYP